MAETASATERPDTREKLTVKNDSGFVLILFLALLPAGLALMFALLAGSTIVKERREAMNECRRELMNGLDAAQKPMKQLLDLNPRAEALRTQMEELRAEELAALSFPPSLPAIEMKIKAVEAQQLLLDLEQKALYLEAQTLLGKSQTAAFAMLTKKVFGKDVLRIRPGRFSITRPALHSVGPGPGPTWEMDTGFSDKQALEQKWQWSFTIRGPAAHFLRGSHTQEEKCSATLENSGPPWKVVLR